MNKVASFLKSSTNDTELRAMFHKLNDSNDPGIMGIMKLLARIWDIDAVNWTKVKQELKKYPSGSKIISEMEKLPHFKEIADGKYEKVKKELGSTDHKDSAEFKSLINKWETFEKSVFSKIESEMVNHYLNKEKK